MNVERDICFLDLETTGLSLSKDRVIEICIIKLNKDWSRQTYYKKINPEGRPIAPGAYEKHGMKLEDLEDCPTFKQVASEVYEFVKDCDFGGFNCIKFDIPILIEEFYRAGIKFNSRNFSVVDVYKILTKAEPRTLEGTYKRFFGRELEGAHGAEADIIATIEVLEKMEEQFEIPKTPDELYKWTDGDDMVDFEGKLKKENNDLVFNFGKYKDWKVQDVFKENKEYFDWILSSDMTHHTKIIFTNLLTILKQKVR